MSTMIKMDFMKKYLSPRPRNNSMKFQRALNGFTYHHSIKFVPVSRISKSTIMNLKKYVEEVYRLVKLLSKALNP